MKELIAMIENSPTYNGHNQIEISHISNKRLLKLYKKLQDKAKDKNYWLELKYCYSSHMENQLSATIYKQYGKREVLYCSFEAVVNSKVFKDSLKKP